MIQIALVKEPAIARRALGVRHGQDREAKQILAFWTAPDEMGRPLVAPPDLPKERIALLRRAFDATMQDPMLRADAAAMKLPVESISGEQVQALIRQVYATPHDVVAEAALASKGR